VHAIQRDHAPESHIPEIQIHSQHFFLI
jgi:hypothetical protein